jgi:hypothetical protein
VEEADNAELTGMDGNMEDDGISPLNTDAADNSTDGME